MLRYAVRLDGPRHLAEVTLRFSVAGDRAQLTLPAWTPGSYLIRDYARFVRDLVVSRDGTPCRVTKTDKTTWAIETGGPGELLATYAVYGHDLTVRTNHIDSSHAFLLGPATFLHPV